MTNPEQKQTTPIAESIDTILSKMQASYMQTHPVFYKEITEIDHTDDFGSLDYSITIMLTPPEPDQTPQSRFFDRQISYGFLQIDTIIYNSLKEKGTLSNSFGGKQEFKYNPETNYLELVFAEQVARKFHQDQKRRNSETPYITHPEYIVKELLNTRKYKEDFKLLQIAWLHDIVEDTPVTLDHIKTYFGEEVANGVNILTRNVDETEYKKRLLKSPEKIQVVKIYDMLHNVSTLNELSTRGIKRKVDDSLSFYIPLALNINMDYEAKQILNFINPYLI
ncbi:MAG: HD domain-containing protein [Candidatus Woesearchaeota archaeon]|jgi:hypothetical protein